jgi:hypothetical protein
MFKFSQGDTLCDKVTGFTGVVIQRIDYISGCNRYLLQPRIDKEGKLSEGIYVDEPALEYIGVLRVVLDRPEGQPPG